MLAPLKFLLTRLMRGVTTNDGKWKCDLLFLLTRLMRGVTSWCSKLRRALKFLLTRLMRGVTGNSRIKMRVGKFLLTRLMRGVTPEWGKPEVGRPISTHTPHARRDNVGSVRNNNDINFYSHASCEA